MILKTFFWVFHLKHLKTLIAVDENGSGEAGESAAEYVFVTPEGRAVSVTDEGQKLNH